jgi:hypothetical protein
MPLWGSSDAASNSVISAPQQVNKAPTRANANTLYGNTTADAYITGVTTSVVHINNSEMNTASVLRSNRRWRQ